MWQDLEALITASASESDLLKTG